MIIFSILIYLRSAVFLLAEAVIPINNFSFGNALILLFFKETGLSPHYCCFYLINGMGIIISLVFGMLESL